MVGNLGWNTGGNAYICAHYLSLVDSSCQNLLLAVILAKQCGSHSQSNLAQCAIFYKILLVVTSYEAL